MLQHTATSRSISQQEQVVFERWLSAAPQGVYAFISRRSTDNPTMAQRIVVFSRGTRHPLYSLHAPLDADCWVVTSLVENDEVAWFPTLRAALNFVRPALLLGPDDSLM